MFPAGYVDRDRPEKVGLGDPKGRGYGVAVGMSWSHSGLDEFGAEFGAGDAGAPKFLEEGVALEDEAVVQGVSQGSLEACMASDGLMDSVA